MFKQRTTHNCYFNQESLTSFPLKNSLSGVHFSCLLNGLCLVTFLHQGLVFCAFLKLAHRAESIAEIISPEVFLYCSIKSDGNITCPSLFVAKFSDKEEDCVCFLKIDGQHITVKPID